MVLCATGCAAPYSLTWLVSGDELFEPVLKLASGVLFVSVFPGHHVYTVCGHCN